jgi:hypothetical protein
LLKPEGIFFLAVPVGLDSVYWNAHRYYGMLRLHPVLSNWNVVDLIGMGSNRINDLVNGELIQPIMVLQKK